MLRSGAQHRARRPLCGLLRVRTTHKGPHAEERCAAPRLEASPGPRHIEFRRCPRLRYHARREATMLPRASSYEEVVRRFRWQIPPRYNIGVDVCDRQRGDGLALIFLDERHREQRFSFADIRQLSNRFANVMGAYGLRRGDRLAILLPQTPETAIAHVAAWKAGLVSVPLFTLFGEDALAFRLSNSGAKAIVTDETGIAKLAAIRDRLPDLAAVFAISGGGGIDFHAELVRASADFTALDTAADDPAIIIYTSGTTGNPKGALHAHRVLLGHLPGVEM